MKVLLDLNVVLDVSIHSAFSRTARPVGHIEVRLAA